MKPFKLQMALISVFLLVMVSSFYLNDAKQSNKAPTNYIPFPGTASFCAAIYNPADSALEIPALKGWGDYHFKISTESDSAQYYFDQGLSMYYAFHNIEAIASFAKATRFDPQCAMAWYGKALALGPTINHSNSYQAPAEALEAAVKSRDLMGGCTEVEKDLIMAMEYRYRPDSTLSLPQLRSNYADAMKMAYDRHQDNADVMALYADALLLMHPWDLYTQDHEPKPWTPEIRSVLEQVLAIAPSHPGANHYYIHTMEASLNPEAALPSARVLDTLMPLVSHITHMPSHIYVRTGNFQKGMRVNNLAVAGFKQYLKAYAPVMDGFGLYQVHNIHLKNNCAQMAGNYRIAAATADTIQSLIPPAFLAMKSGDGNYMQELYAQPIITKVRFGKWGAILKMPVIDTLPYVNALQLFARGMAYSRLNNPAAAALELQALEEKMKDQTLTLNLDNFSAPYDVLVVASFILKGAMAEDQQRYDEAINLYSQAVGAEDSLIYIEPRSWLLPSRQYLGNALLKAGENEKAIAVFKEDLAVTANNGWSLTGLKQAYLNTNNKMALANIRPKLKEAWAVKDVVVKAAVY
ncbi:tetratricopeptide repeat protein [Pedobacter immunditicola]|uniref:tetratricopeptide repeat protein n=1 Tax=Pedobacter immunditicola TaxID=3133440 RepID=UPI0030A99513